MTLVVDASVALKWVLEEEDAGRARAMIGVQRFIAPDFLLLECANALTQQVRRALLRADDAVLALQAIQEVGMRLVPGQALVAEAQRLSLAMKASSYDSLYLAVALREGCKLLTADVRFAEAAERLYPDAIQRF